MTSSIPKIFNRYRIATLVGLFLASSAGAILASAARAQPTGFATRQDSAEVVIVDLSNGTVLGTIPTLDTSPFEIALSPDASTLHITHAGRGEDAVNILDVASASALQRVGVGSTPIEIALLPDGSKLYTADFLGGTVSVVDIASRTRVATIPTAFLSYDVAAAPDGSRVFATSLRDTNLFVIDPSTDTVVDRIPIGRDFLGHVAITPDGQKAYVTEFRNRITIINLASRTVVGTIPFNAAGANPNNGALDIEIDRQGIFAYALGFDTVNVISLATNEVVATVPIGIQLSDVAVDSTGKFVYVTTLHQTADLVPFNEIVKIETDTFTIQDRFVIGGLLVGMVVEPVPPPADTTPPTTTVAVAPAPNANGWNNTDVTVTVTGIDDAGGSGVKEIAFSLAGAETREGVVAGSSATLTVTAEGTATLTYFARDNAGNQEAAQTLTIRIDRTPPSISAVVSPVPNAAGWNNADVTVSFQPSDGLSGINAVSSPVIVTTEGAGQVVTGTATDRAGNSASATVTINLDKTVPVITGLPAPGCTLSPPNHQLVQVATVTATDALSGLSPGSLTIIGISNEPESGLGDGDTAPDIVMTGTTVELRAERSGTGTGRIYTLTATASDLAGNRATATETCAVSHDER